MKRHSNSDKDIRNKIIGFGEKSIKKNYYPVLLQQVEQLTAQKLELEEQNQKMEELMEELTIAKEKAEESDRLKSSFLANLSHEIRTPMNGIIGFSEILKEKNINENKKKEYLNIIINSSQQLLEIVNDILDISILETGNFKISKTKFSVNHTINDIYHSLMLEVKNKDIRLFQAIALPEQECYIESDLIRLMQVFNKLIKNSIKFTSKGYIRFGYETNHNDYIFFVEDTGIGIPKEMQEQIFEPFRQADESISKLTGGMGLGLSICKRIVNLLGGEIWLESEVAKGTTVFFNLPRHQ